ncbi:MAG: hypothetical protein COA58_01310 [Bacteroidetes bacterium]|nr:MAG: hypothetical protein COA58_01310 [Bacteroidota bacterium]
MNPQDHNSVNLENETSNLEITDIRFENRDTDNFTTLTLQKTLLIAIISAQLVVLMLSLINAEQGIGMSLLVAGTLAAFFGTVFFALTQGQKNKLKENAKKWKRDARECIAKTRACKDAMDWVKKNGKFAPYTNPIDFDRALGLGGGKSLAGAYRLAKLLGLLGQESSFGTDYGTSDKYKGPFQLSEEVINDYNRHNDPDVTFSEDIDDKVDFDTAAKVAAWYIAFILQQLTWSSMNPRIVDIEEANKFALAAYNGGLGTIKDAQKKCKDAGKDSTKWDNVKDYLPDGASVDSDTELTAEEKKEKKEKIKKKTEEIKDYVDQVREYERLAKELKCV